MRCNCYLHGSMLKAITGAVMCYWILVCCYPWCYPKRFFGVLERP